MYKKLFLTIISISFLFSAATFAQRANIEGTYKLVVRKLSDGTKVMPPDVMGLMTFTKTHRNFNIVWKDKDGKHFSSSIASTYKLTNTDYTETLIFSIMNDEISGKGLTYTMSEQSSTVPVKITDGKIEIKMPFDPVTVVFDGNRIVATSEGQFTDYWEKIDQ
jgi:hypothetical protein